MISSNEIPFDVMKKNCKEYIEEHSNGKIILRQTDGKKDYKQIAKELGISKYGVSTALNAAHKLGLAARIRPGVFKKNRGVMSHIHERNAKKKAAATIKKIVEVAKKKPRLIPMKESLLSNRPIKNLEKMTIAYRNLFIVENTLRELIRKVYGENVFVWWEQKVNSSTKATVKEAIENHPYHGYKRKDELEYTHLGQLKEIIAGKKNWSDFAPHLKEKDRASFSATMDKAIPSRNCIGHCIPLKGDDLKYVEMRFQDILKMIK